MKQILLPADIPLITKQNLRLLFPDISGFTFDQNIKNWLKNGRLIALKKGLYIFGEYFRDNRGDELYWEYLVNQTYQPSYLSREYMLQKYSVLTEAVYTFTSVSLKSGREFRNKLGAFNYYNVKSELFTGWRESRWRGKIIYKATRAKALFDYLYSYKRAMSFVNEKQIEELRLNLDEYGADDWKEFEKYLALAKSAKLNKIYKLIKKVYVDGAN